jgi:hypothetical protein
MPPASRTSTPRGKAAATPKPVEQKKDAVRVPRPKEFGGNIGGFFWTFFIPAAVCYAYGLNVMENGSPVNPLDKAFWQKLIFELPDGIAVRPTKDGFYILSGWIFLQFLFQQFMPGPINEGRQLTNGKKLPYKLNAFRSWCATWIIAVAGVHQGYIDPTVFFMQFGSLMAWAQIYAYGISLYLYVHFGLLWRRWKDSPEYEADWGVFTIKDFWADFWMGTCRNPRVFHFLGYPFDFKFFFEARPGLILWVLINWSTVAAMYYGCDYRNKTACKATGDWSRVPNAAWIISASHTYYIFDYCWHEIAILTTTDIIHEPFGFMLMWGDMGFLPWMYTNSFTLYLAYVRPAYKAELYLDGICIGLWLLAMFLFRQSNIQKNNFRTYAANNKNNLQGFKIWGKPVEYIATKQGNLMLTSGFWGMCRHPNYAPDMIMAFAWWLNCTAHQTSSLVPFGYVIYFWSMDIHRFFRDEARCAKKYGADWDRYVKAVPYCLIPGIW